MKSLRQISIAAVLLLVGCSDSKVVIQGKPDGKRLVYDCSNFQPQVETVEDIKILVYAASETISNAVHAQSIVAVSEISDAFEKQDWRRLEKAVVMYKCSHKPQ